MPRDQSVTDLILIHGLSNSGPEATQTVLFRKESGCADILQLISDTASEQREETDPADVFRTVLINPERLGPLLSEEENLTARDDEGQTPLHLAALWCDHVTVSSLVNAGAHIAAEDLSGLMPVHYAAIAGNLENLKHLSSQLNVSGRRAGRYPLHYAAMAGRREVVAYILEHGGVNIDAQDCQGYTAMVLAAVCDQPETVKLLIQKGASASVRDNSGTSALSEVALHYENLADLLLDRYVVHDQFDNSTAINLRFVLDSEKGHVKTKETSYRMLVRANEMALGHPAATTLTNAMWKLFARKLYIIKMILMFFFNIFWTVKYLMAEGHEYAKYWSVHYIFIVMGYMLSVSHIAATLFIARQEHILTSALIRSARKTHRLEKALNHRLTRQYTQKMNMGAYNGVLSKTRSRLARELLFAVFIDAGLIYFTSIKLYSFLGHEDENFSNVTVRLSEIATSLILLMLWIRLFMMGNIAPSFGRFVIFTEKTVYDIASILGVYIILFIPAVVIFYHTIYRFDKSGVLPWYDVPFMVMRMAVVDYDFQLGYDIAKKEGLELWWNVFSLLWIFISGIIIMNLFIALMADRYTSLGEKSDTISSQKRARFIADCELFLGLKRAMKYEEQLLQDGDTIVLRSDGNAFKDPSESHGAVQEKFQQDLDLISEKLDKLIAAQHKGTPTASSTPTAPSTPTGSIRGALPSQFLSSMKTSFLAQ